MNVALVAIEAEELRGILRATNGVLCTPDPKR